MNLNAYIGIPYKDHGRDRAGLDCWGLVDLVYRELLAVELPDYRRFYQNASDTTGVAALLGMAALGQGDVAGWRPVPADAWRPLDALLLRVGRHHCHVGLLAGEGNFLHCLAGRAATLEPLDSFIWGSAVRGAFRWTAKP